jgi:hypothetical protein
VDIELVGQGINRIDPEHVDAGVGADIAGGDCQDDRAVHRPVRAFTVVGLEVANVPGGLIDVGPVGVSSTLELEDEDRPAHEQDDVGAPELQRELVLKDGRVVSR